MVKIVACIEIAALILLMCWLVKSFKKSELREEERLQLLRDIRNNLCKNNPEQGEDKNNLKNGFKMVIERDFGKFKRVLFSNDDIELLKKVLPSPATIPGLSGMELRQYREILTEITGENYRFPDTDDDI